MCIIMRSFVTYAILTVFVLQGRGQDSTAYNDNHPTVHRIAVKDVIQTTSYTYIQAEENDALQWIAIPKMEATVGETYYFHGGMEMRDFKSKELDRTFDSILFLNGLINPEVVEGGKTVLNVSAQKTKTAEEKSGISIDPVEGGITIAELFSNKEKYANKIVRIKGKVTKFNSRIMGKNWIHLQDGTSSSGEFDLTATSADEVSIGDIVTIEGVITIDKDFGAGYYYNIIMENGRIVASTK